MNASGKQAYNMLGEGSGMASIAEDAEAAAALAAAGAAGEAGTMKVVGEQELQLMTDGSDAHVGARTAQQVHSPPARSNRVTSLRAMHLPDIPSIAPSSVDAAHLYGGGASLGQSWPGMSSVMSSSSAGTRHTTSSHSWGRRSNQTVSGADTVHDELKALADDLTAICDQYHHATRPLELSRAAMAINQALKDCATSTVEVADGSVSLHSDPAVGRIVKVVLHFTDNLLTTPALQPVKMYMLRALYTLGLRLKLLPSHAAATVPYPRNFAMGSIPELPALDTVNKILASVCESDASVIQEQEGAFVAPVLRGIAPEFAVPCLQFGFPAPEQTHVDAMVSMFSVSADIHFCCHKNYIRAAAGTVAAPPAAATQSQPSTVKQAPGTAFVPPYRVPTDAREPPMAVSLATTTAQTHSGTLGGYIYPKIDPRDENLSEYAQSTFAMTCAHVCLSENHGAAYPQVSVPSPVLINYYKNALENQCRKYPPFSQERIGYEQAIAHIETQYPAAGSGDAAKWNRPADAFGKVVWGERKVENGAMSDIAIIKCNPKLKCRNYLGDDVPFSQYDPALMFGGLYVKRVVSKLSPGMNVFKYGSMSKYTTGKINGPRIVYWADGKVQSSEFVVASDSPVFATGGDSGAWILQKSSDTRDATGGSDYGSTVTGQTPAGPSLGVVGMLHSYDGERKEFGLFSPIDSILNRLYDVTQIQWGIVGVPDEYDESLAWGSDSDAVAEDSHASSDEGK